MINNKTKRLAVVIAAALLILGVALWLIFGRSAPRGSSPIGVNLLSETDFTLLSDGDGRWYEDAYVFRPEYTTFSFEEGRSGGVCGHISNKIGNDARFAMDVSVEPDSLYCLSGYIRADCKEGLGANLSVSGVYAFSEPLYDTRGDWEQMFFYGRTGPKQTEVTLYARLGGYSGEAVGDAWFDQLSLTRVETVPEGYSAARWYDEAASAPDTEGDSRPAGALLPSLALVLFGALYAALLAAAAVHGQSRRQVSVWAFCLPLFIGALVLRLILAVSVHGYDVDVGDFQAWAENLLSFGPSGFYTQAGFCDYPPGYILLLGAFARIAHWFGGSASETLIKLPPILADLLGAGLLTACCVRRSGASIKSRRWPLAALVPGILYLLNPMVLLTGAGWGQSDGVMMLFLLVTVLFGMKARWAIALPAYVLAVLIKPQALMFGPLGLAALAVWYLRAHKDKALLAKGLRSFLIGAAASLVLAALIIWPFKGSQPFGWLIALYRRTMGYYAYATVNACNLYFLIGDNWVDTASTASFLFPLLAGLLLAIPALPAWLRCRKTSPKAAILCLITAGFAALLMLTALFPFSYSAYSTILIVFLVLLTLAAFILSGALKHLPLYGAGLLTLLFCLGGMMHERYLFAALPLFILAWFIEKDDRVLAALGLSSLSSFLNAGCVLSRNARIGGASSHLSAPQFAIASDMALLEYAAAVSAVLAAGLSLYLLLRRADGAARPLRLRLPRTAGAEADSAPRAGDDSLACEEENWLSTHRMDRRDWIILLSLTAAYAVLAFWHLGSFTSPQTGYMFTAVDETVTFDLGENHDDFRMLYIGGVHQYDREFTVQTSEDGAVWSDALECNMDIGNLFQWYYVRSWKGKDNNSLSGRYVRIVSRPGLNLYEVLFRDAGGNVLPVLSAESSAGEDVSALIDEQDTLQGEPGWFNSMYFDEIYHARTAYEHLTGLYPYETTHPPLGKVLMSFCVALFGMTPFGWRFAGALCGVLMLPGMYLLGRLLFKKRRFAVLALLLMALDTLHYTQTRLATIDSFVVLFIIWSYYFMFRWFWSDFFDRSFRRTLLPLFLSGLFMGLAVASKWTGCYAGVGLAVIFFVGIFRRLRLSARARARLKAQASEETDEAAQQPAPDVSPERLTAMAERGVPRVWATLLSCLVFFVAVPLLIYYLSYIPYFAPSGGVTVKKVIEAAVGSYFTNGQMGGMLGYHAQPGLGMDHPFYSPWYEWPFSATPMYYAADGYEPAGFASTILAFGNPAVWWVGFLALLLTLFALLSQQALPLLTGRPSLSPGPFRPEGGRDRRPLLLILSFAAQYLPWMLVPRGTYIYHYFPCVPFIILDICLIADYWTDWRVYAASAKAAARGSAFQAAVRRADRRALLLTALYILLTAALFIAFFPYASGLMVRTSWLDAMNWFGNLYY